MCLALAGGCGGGTGGSALVATSALPAAIRRLPAPRFRLADARGGTLSSVSLRGTPYLVTFLYTRCPDVCPLIADELRRALELLGPAGGDLEVVAVSVDPEHDTPAAVREWLALHREPANFHYLIGTRARLEPLWKAYFAAPQVPGDPSSSHTAVIWLVDRRGRRVATIDAGRPLTPGGLAADLRRLESRA